MVASSFNDVLALAPVLAVIAEAEVVIASDSFGFCSRYEACSDAQKCIHPNPIFAAACTYKKNLEQGRIFYGKNKNIWLYWHSMGTTIRYSVEEIWTIVSELAAQYGAERIYLFGSYARSDANIDSDIALRIDKGSIRGL